MACITPVEVVRNKVTNQQDHIVPLTSRKHHHAQKMGVQHGGMCRVWITKHLQVLNLWESLCRGQSAFQTGRKGLIAFFLIQLNHQRRPRLLCTDRSNNPHAQAHAVYVRMLAHHQVRKQTQLCPYTKDRSSAWKKENHIFFFNREMIWAGIQQSSKQEFLGWRCWYWRKIRFSGWATFQPNSAQAWKAFMKLRELFQRY